MESETLDKEGLLDILYLFYIIKKNKQVEIIYLWIYTYIIKVFGILKRKGKHTGELLPQRREGNGTGEEVIGRCSGIRDS